MSKRIVQIWDGEWMRAEDSYTHFCCDCYLAHKKELKLENGVLYERWITLKAETKRERKKRGIKVG